jgi:hypothetical protein
VACARTALLVGGVAMVLNASQLTRNERTFGNPLGDPTHLGMVSTETHRPRAILMNAVKNTALHVGTPFDAVNAMLTRAVGAVGRVFHEDIDEPAFGGFAVPAASTHEDIAGNPVLLLLMLVSVVRDQQVPTLTAAACRVCGGCVAAIRCAAQMAAMEYTASDALLRPRSRPCGCLARSRVEHDATPPGSHCRPVCALPGVVLNASRPMMRWNDVGSVFTTPREDQYFANNPSLRSPMHELAARINDSGCRTIGLKTHENGYEHPLWRLTRAQAVHIEFQDPDVGKPPSAAPEGQFPCLLVTIRPSSQFTVDAHEWRHVLRVAELDLFERATLSHED